MFKFSQKISWKVSNSICQKWFVEKFINVFFWVLESVKTQRWQYWEKVFLWNNQLATSNYKFLISADTLFLFWRKYSILSSGTFILSLFSHFSHFSCFLFFKKRKFTNSGSYFLLWANFQKMKKKTLLNHHKSIEIMYMTYKLCPWNF